MANLRKGALAFFLLSGLFLFGCTNQKKESEKIIPRNNNPEETSQKPQSFEQPKYYIQIPSQQNNSIERETISIKTSEQKFKEELEKWQGWDYNSPFALRINVLDRESEIPLSGSTVQIRETRGDCIDQIVTTVKHQGKTFLKNFYINSSDDKGLVVFCLRKKDLDEHCFDNSVISVTKEGYYKKDFVFSFQEFYNLIKNSRNLSRSYDSTLSAENIRFTKSQNYQLRIIFNDEANEEDYSEQVKNLRTNFLNKPYNHVYDQVIGVINLDILMGPIKEHPHRE